MNPLDKKFRDQLQHHEATPPAALWDRLEDHLAEKKQRKGLVWWQYAGAVAATGTLVAGFWWASQNAPIQQNTMAVVSQNVATDTLNVVQPTNKATQVTPAHLPSKKFDTQPHNKPNLLPSVPEHLAERKAAPVRKAATKVKENQVVEPIETPNIAVIEPQDMAADTNQAMPSNLLAEVQMPSVAPLVSSEEIVVELKPQRNLQINSEEADAKPEPKTKFGKFLKKVRRIRNGEEDLQIGEKLNEQKNKLIAIIAK
jgi:hypothetical protein